MHAPPLAAITFEPGDEATELLSPPAPGLNVCPICRGAVIDSDDVCMNCREHAVHLGADLQEVVPISMYEKPSRLRDWLTFYKSGEAGPAHPGAAQALRHILLNFWDASRHWVDELQPEAIVVVPSTSRVPPHPLAQLLQSLEMVDVPVLPALVRTEAPVGHNQSSTNAFRLANVSMPDRVLLFDDVYTSGARGQSAAFALREAGVHVTAFCVVGRRYNRGWNPAVGALLDQQANTPFDWDARSRLPIRT